MENYLETQLTEIIKEASIYQVSFFIEELYELTISDTPPTKEDLVAARRKYESSVATSVFNLLAEETPEIEEQIQEIIDEPDIYGCHIIYKDENYDNNSISAGKVFALLHWIIYGKLADANTCIQLDWQQDLAIKAAIHEL